MVDAIMNEIPEEIKGEPPEEISPFCGGDGKADRFYY